MENLFPLCFNKSAKPLSMASMSLIENTGLFRQGPLGEDLPLGLRVGRCLGMSPPGSVKQNTLHF